MLVKDWGSVSNGFNPPLRFRRDMFTRGSTYPDDVGGEEREWGLPRNGQECRGELRIRRDGDCASE